MYYYTPRILYYYIIVNVNYFINFEKFIPSDLCFFGRKKIIPSDLPHAMYRYVFLWNITYYLNIKVFEC